MSAVAIDLERLRTWVGRTETRTDLATAAPYAALSATLDREDLAQVAYREQRCGAGCRAHAALATASAFQQATR